MLAIPQVKLENHPYFPGKKQEAQHRVVMAEHLKRPLKEWESVGLKNAESIGSDSKGRQLYDMSIDNLVLRGTRDESLRYTRDPAWKPDIMLDSGAYTAWKN